MRGAMTMRTRGFILLVALTALTLPLLAGADDALWDRSKLEYPTLREVTLPDVERVVLPNNMVLYILEDHDFPVVSGQVLVRAGSMLDPTEKAGLADMTGTVLRTGGSERFPGDDLDRRLESIGASIEFGIGETDGSGSFWCLRENASEVLEIFADLIRNPTFPEEKIELAKVSLRRAIAGRNDEPFSILSREMAKLIWGKDHPYALHPEYATVEAVTRDDLVGFHKEYFHPDRIYLTVWGDFDANKVRRDIEKHFGDWPAVGTPPPEQPPIAPIVPGGGLAYAEKKATTNTIIVAGHVGLRASDPDYAAINVLAEILGTGFASRLFNEIRTKRGLAYMAGSSSGTSIPRPGVFFGYAGTRSDSALVTLGLLRRELRKVTEEPVTQEELDRARDGILNSYVFQYASKGRIASRMAYLDFYGYPEDFTSSYPEQVKALTVDDLLAAARRHIYPDDFQVLLVGNEEDFAEPLSSLGVEYETVDLTIPEPPSKIDIPDETPENLAEGKRLLALAADATGGSAAWASIDDIAVEIDMSVTVQGMDLSVYITSVHTNDGRDYVSQVLPFGEMIMASYPEGGWKKSPQGIEDLTDEEKAQINKDHSRDFSELFGKIDDMKALPLGQHDFDGRTCDAIVITGEELDRLFLYIDPETSMPIGMQYQGQSMTGPVEATKFMRDFREVGDVKMAHQLEIHHDGEPFAKAILKSVKINEGVDEALFAKPE